MGRIKCLLLGGFTIIASIAIAQPGAQKLESLEWANFGTGNGQGFVVYTPNTDGEPQYYSFVQLLNDLGIGASTDDQQIIDFIFDGNTQQLTLTLEDGGTQSVSLSALEESLQLIGNNLSIVGDTPIDLSPYLDNTDNQQLTDFSLVGTVLSLTLEDGGTLSVNIAQQETDPDFNSSPASGITSQDISNWNDDLVNDQDSIVGNEYDPVTYSQSQIHDHVVEGPRVNGDRDVVIEYYIDSTITAFGFGVESSDDQQLSFDTTNFQLTIEEGIQPVDLSILKQSDEICIESTVNSNTHTFTELQTITSVEILGVGAFDKPTRAHTQHVTINNNQITFYETLDNDTVRACGVQ